MKVERRFTHASRDVYGTIEWTKRTSRITNADGSVVFEMKDAEIPKQWSQLAADIMVSKYFRKAGVPQDGGPRGIASACTEEQRHEGTKETPRPQPSPDGRVSRIGPESSAKQVIHRLAGCWAHWGEKYGYFDTPGDAEAFYDELAYMMLHQMAAPNSPQWFNTGLNWAYGISGPAQGHYVADHKTGVVTLADDAYTHPQPHACFIQSINDDLVNPGGIMDLWVREARLFKYGSGTGTNFSRLRGENEKLSGGGKSSGLMSFLKIGDRAAGAIKSGGTTRRAAKMVCLDADHPDIESFVNWKVREELKVAAMVEGMKHLSEEQKNLAKQLGLDLDYDFNGEAYHTVSGQNSNNSVRLTDAFFDSVDRDEMWTLTRRTDGAVSGEIKARDLWRQICFAAWRCADPGVQYDSTINGWHTCPAGGRINASNPCSEYMFLDNTACNLASLNVLRFFDPVTRSFDIAAYEHAIRLWTIVLEISVLMASFPSREIAELSWRYRTLGLGYANLGAMLMQAGIAYDSDEGRAICAALTAIMTGRSYAASAEMAAQLGPFPGFAENREHMLRVMRNHRRAARGESGGYEQLRTNPVPIDHSRFHSDSMRLSNANAILDHAVRAWDDAITLGERNGYRNAQTTVIAPTGTIGLLMDCDTTGVEPDFALVKFKKLAGGGYFKIANDSLRPSLRSLGYSDQQTDEIVSYVMGTLALEPRLIELLRNKGYTSDDLIAVENALPTVFELSMAFNAWSMPEHVLITLGIDPGMARRDPAFNGLRAMGLSRAQIDLYNRVICGTQTIEGAPHLKSEHLPVFDCANKCGKLGTRFIETEGHIRMMAAAQPFISGAISKTINLPNEATVEDIASSYRLSWELGLKANALYRDGCKLSQPLSTKSDMGDGEEEKDEQAVEEALGEVSSDVAAAAAAAASAMKTSSTSSASRASEDISVEVKRQHADALPSLPVEPRYIEKIVERIVERPLRRRLPDTRESITHKFNVAGHEGYLVVGLYDDGAPGELFITMAKEGSTIGGLMDSLGTAISVALQYGVPLASLVKKFEHQRFEPMGMTTNSEIPFAKSLVDYIFRWMGMQFIEGYREQNAPQRGNGRQRSPATAGAARGELSDTEDDEHHGAPIARSSESDSDLREGSDRFGGLVDEAPPIAPPDAPKRDRSIARTRIDIAQRERVVSIETSTVMNQANASLMGDAPACDVCGSITVRSGTCYKCLNCGNSMGCS
jgi:ribonucleoside-diphosphate reductase alpha chain